MTCFLALIPLAMAAASEPSSETARPAVTVHLDAPQDWSGETISLPPGFARTMSLKGVEVIRFAPGMFRPDSDSFFTYAFVFWLPDTGRLTKDQLRTEFLKYYRGLATAVARNRQLAVSPDDFQLNLTADPKHADRFLATLQWAEPFRTGAAQTLRFRIRSRTPESRNGLLLSVAVSPQPYRHSLWKQLAGILKSVRFTDAENGAETENSSDTDDGGRNR